jgi:2-hydroxy-3-keto-5-methylthiopentenyl-1-phosphate phosphatase
MAHTIRFDNDVCAGEIRINPAFYNPQNKSLGVCKSNVLRCFLTDPTLPAINLRWVIGDNINDLQLMQLADRAFAIDSKSPLLRNEPFITQIESFEELLAMLPNHELVVQPSV